MHKISVGPASIAGWLGFAGAEVTAFAELNPAGVSPHTLTVLGLIALVATNAGRQLQAAAAAHGSNSLLPTDEQELATAAAVTAPAPSAVVPPQSAVVPDGAQQAAPPAVG
jgi:hypothetical protein